MLGQDSVRFLLHPRIALGYSSFFVNFCLRRAGKNDYGPAYFICKVLVHQYKYQSQLQSRLKEQTKGLSFLIPDVTYGCST